MLFSSPWYFAFLALLLVALAPPFTVTTKKRILAVASCLFYAFWDYRYLGLLLAISVIDYVCARAIARPESNRRKAWLVVSIVSNLGILGYFKYCNFFIDNLNGLLPNSFEIPHQQILLPAGISFYTFKTMSYVIDVYRKELSPVRSWMDYATFITFFPELIAGPIVRASVLLPQLDRNIGPKLDRLAAGASLFLLGFTKKLAADRLGNMFDPVFATPGAFSCATAWGATLGYALQIYCDFAGYSDMAIGSAMIVGYQLPENFRMPYLSRNLTEFWRRWHMTLSSWLRDYLYVPLGGNRRGAWRTYANLMLTMVLGGLWHGASWNFVLWGALHGLVLALERASSRRFPQFRLPGWLAMSLTFGFVSLCWIPFRCSTFATTTAFLSRLFVPGGAGVTWLAPDFAVIVALLVLGHSLGAAFEAGEARPAVEAWCQRLLSWSGAELVRDNVTGNYVRLGLRTGLGVYVVVVWVILAFLFAPTKLSPFIYFQF